ncbi:hypothetical protein AK830_g7611 [Neonectria ditissima]|uniref:Uncharacterized protein n=1 Tax=Neonectria ditissima TaxID=78410 RepID=A0A0P7BDE7_9HYPO|nr:hypothetical protein AK830_g7611 [Neonectria ditissima]
MDASAGPFHGIAGANTTVIVVPDDTRGRHQSFVVAISTGVIIFVVVFAFTIFLVLRYRTQKRRHRARIGRTAAEGNSTNRCAPAFYYRLIPISPHTTGAVSDLTSAPDPDRPSSRHASQQQLSVLGNYDDGGCSLAVVPHRPVHGDTRLRPDHNLCRPSQPADPPRRGRRLGMRLGRPVELHDELVAEVRRWAVERGDPVLGGDKVHPVRAHGGIQGRVRGRRRWRWKWNKWLEWVECWAEGIVEQGDGAGYVWIVGACCCWGRNLLTRGSWSGQAGSEDLSSDCASALYVFRFSVQFSINLVAYTNEWLGGQHDEPRLDLPREWASGPNQCVGLPEQSSFVRALHPLDRQQSLGEQQPAERCSAENPGQAPGLKRLEQEL